ncbi:hypothetical protein KKA53_05345 [Candidatus Dependentiae bacterium]|nr:hypothetical protein [Candidatus Dependentiae bacterium]
MTKEEIRVIVQGRLESEVTAELRQAVVKLLSAYVGPGLLSPEMAGPLLDPPRSYRSLYRWLSASWDRRVLPQFSELPAILDFIDRVERLRAAWKDILAGWRTDQNADVKRVFFNPQFMAVLESDMPIEDKLDKLVKKTVSLISRELEAGGK